MFRPVKQIPNFITLLNLLSGSVAVVFAIDGHLIWAGIFICVAAIMDFLDGFTAKLLHATSEIGKQLDSLADVVSFGLAPGTILFTLLEFSLFKINQPIYEINAHWTDWLILFSAFLIPIFGAIRLAKFNINKSDNSFFKGLPIPANALFWASLGLMLEVPKYQEIFQYLYSTVNLLILEVFFSGIMVINLPMFSLKFNSFNFINNWYRYLFLATAVLLIAFFSVYGIALTIAGYIIYNIGFYIFNVKF